MVMIEGMDSNFICSEIKHQKKKKSKSSRLIDTIKLKDK